MPQAKTIVGIGEILWDMFPTGKKLGGAPLNFVASAAGISAALAETGNRFCVVSQLGSDVLGRQAIEEIEQRGIRTNNIQVSDRPTGRVDVTIDSEGKASYDFARGCGWENLNWHPNLERLARQCDVVCFGSLGQHTTPSRKTIQRFVTATRPDAIRFFDANLRPPFVDHDAILSSLEIATVLKLNDDELQELASLLDVSGSEIEQVQQILQKFDLRTVAVTKGAKGAIAVQADQVVVAPAEKTVVVDTVGAGDSFNAMLAQGLLKGQSLEPLIRTAIRVASFVCTQPGATPKIPSEILAA